MIRVLVDTREQTPFTFIEAHVKKAALKTGDYCLEGDRDGLVIERKTVEDLVSTVTIGIQRFTRELERLSRCAFPVLLVEGMPVDVQRGSRFIGASGSRVLNHVIALCVTYGVSPMFCYNEAEANMMAYRLLKARSETKGKMVCTH